MGKLSMKKMKLNVGASPIWEKNGWWTLDHKKREDDKYSIIGEASNIPLNNESCEVIFCSHMFEHIPHTKLEDIVLEFNRLLEKNGILRILTPDLKEISKAYVEKNKFFFQKAKEEDENIRTDLGLGGMLMNFIVSPGQDTALFNRNIDTFISGYAHIYLYDFEMLEIILSKCGFYSIQQMQFCESDYDDFIEPLHVFGFKPEWKPLNRKFYEKNNLIHYYDENTGKYNINFKLTGFDRDPITSLIIECKKNKTVNKSNLSSDSKKNYNRYGQSLLKDTKIQFKVNLLKEVSRLLDKM